MQAKKSDSPDLDYGRRSRPRSVSYLLTGFSPAMATFRPHSLLCNAVFRFLQATLETCSSSQFRASRFIALSLQTIRREITCNYNSSLANILNCQDSSILRMCQHRCDILSAHTKHDGFGFIKFCKFTMKRQMLPEIIGLSAFWVTEILTANSFYATPKKLIFWTALRLLSIDGWTYSFSVVVISA